MDVTTGRFDLLPASVPGAVVLLLAVAGALAWLGARALTHRHAARLPWFASLAARCAAASVAAWCGLQALGRWTELAGSWPIALAALVAGASIEGVAALYARERRVVSRRVGLALTALRGGAMLLVLLMLMQPSFVWSVNRAIVRRVAVLFDESDSMQFVDRQWTTTERIQLGLHAGLLERRERPLPSLDDLPLLQTRVRPWATSTMETNRVPPVLAKVLEDGAAQARELQAQTDTLVGQLKGDEAQAVREPLSRLQRQVRDGLAPAFVEALTAAAGSRLTPAQLLKLGDAMEQTADAGAPAREAADTICWARLGDARRAAIDAFCTTTRVALARDILTRRPAGGEALLDRLADRYDLDLMRLGRGVERVRIDQARTLAPEPAATNALAHHDWTALISSNEATLVAQQAFRSLTDYPAALETILKDIPSEQLAGVLIVSDGRNNSEASIDPVGRRLGLQGVPVCGIVVGGSRLPLDVAIAEVHAPESIYLGDKVRVQTVIHVTGARGRRIVVRMNGATGAVDHVALDISSDDYTREIRLTDEPKEQGIRSYTVQADILEGELFTANNTWKFDVAVSDDRTNVLLVDNQARWEFRYLRNLFFGRDKSVHLQDVLLHPETVAGATATSPLPPASASRKFGDAEAGSLPQTRDEWRKFDVIILGDLGPDVLKPEVVDTLRHCVGERGALLVVVAGPHAMPHGLSSVPFQDLLPERYTVDSDGCWTPPEEKYRLLLTAAGRTHPVMQQSANQSENEAIWGELSELTWRFPVLEVKPGAEVLAYAQPAETEAQDPGAMNVADAAARIDAETRKRSRNALIVAQNYGRGKVLMLNFDQTWRLRSRAGDKYHHQFWGQVLRWGTGEKLRAGREGLRLGTDALIYTPQQPVRILARVTEENRVGAVADAALDAVVRYNDRDVAHVHPTYRAGSQGFYEAEIPPPGVPGRYDVILKRQHGGTNDTVETAFLVVTSDRPVELADVTATRATLETLARWTNGRVVGPARAGDLWNVFGEGRRAAQERRELPLWDRPWIFLLLAGLLTGEWLLRKLGGLA